MESAPVPEGALENDRLKRQTLVKQVRSPSLLDLFNRSEVANEHKSTQDMEDYISKELTPNDVALMEEGTLPEGGIGVAPGCSSGLNERRILMLEQRKNLSGTFQTSQQNMEEILKLADSESDHPQTDPSSENAHKKEERSVRFGRVYIQEYLRMLGDNPGGSRGPPMTISWEVVNQMHVRVDKFEKIRKYRRRHATELRTTSKYRVQVLRKLGVTVEQMYEATRDAECIREQRYFTHAGRKHARFDERMEIIRRAIWNALSFGKIKRKEREFLQKYVPSYRERNKT